MGKVAYVLFPDDCRLCEQPLLEASRIPVCRTCLGLPRPLATEFCCRQCRTPFVSSYPLDEHDLCIFCREGQVTFDATYSFGSYEGSLRQLIHLFKYSKIQTLAKPLGELVVRALPLEARFDVVMPMPMHWRKRWTRGFNQAELLAEPVARRYGVPVSKHLRRTRLTKAQASLSKEQRSQNLQGSFRLERANELWGKRVLLVDDVLTTGATLREAAATVKTASPRSVTALTLARVDFGGDDRGATQALQGLDRAVNRAQGTRAAQEVERVAG